MQNSWIIKYVCLLDNFVFTSMTLGIICNDFHSNREKFVGIHVIIRIHSSNDIGIAQHGLIILRMRYRIRV